MLRRASPRPAPNTHWPATTCTAPTSGAVDTAGFNAAPGTNASIHVEVWCTVDLFDIAVTGLPGSKTLHDSATSPLDPARDITLGLGIAEPTHAPAGESA